MTGATPTSRSAMSIKCKAMPINCSAMPINLRDANQLAQHQAIWCNHNQSTVAQRHQPTEAQINFMITSVQLQHPKAARNKTKQTKTDRARPTRQQGINRPTNRTNQGTNTDTHEANKMSLKTNGWKASRSMHQPLKITIARHTRQWHMLTKGHGHGMVNRGKL